MCLLKNLRRPNCCLLWVKNKNLAFKQNEIAYRCGFDKSSYNSIEAGKRNITIHTLYKIAEALEEPIVSFME